MKNKLIRTALATIQLLLKLLSPILRPLEANTKHRHLASSSLNDCDALQPVFIIGAPRSGTTFLYQVLTSELECSYFNNLSHILSPYAVLANSLNRHLFRSPHQNFDSDYGATTSGGLNAPSEMGPFWRHYFGTTFDTPLSSHLETQLTGTCKAIARSTEKTLLIKNLPVVRRLQEILKAFPQARFLLCQREPIFTLQSILQARRVFKVPQQEFWSLQPPGVDNAVFESEVQHVAYQIRAVENFIMETMHPYAEQLLVIDYEDFCQNTDSSISTISEFTGMPRRNIMFKGQKWKPQQLHLSATQLAEAEKYLSLDWVEFRNVVDTAS